MIGGRDLVATSAGNRRKSRGVEGRMMRPSLSALTAAMLVLAAASACGDGDDRESLDLAMSGDESVEVVDTTLLPGPARERDEAVRAPEVTADGQPTDASDVDWSVCDLGYQLERTTFLVAAAATKAGDPLSLALTDGEITVRPYTIDVAAVAWTTSLPPEAPAPAIGPVTVVDGPHVVMGPNVVDDLDAAFVGIQAVPDSHAAVYGTPYTITFVATEHDGRPQFVTSAEPARCDDAYTALATITGTQSLTENLDRYHAALAASNAGDPADLQSYHQAIESATREPEPTWWDLPASLRPLTPDSIPDELRPRLEAIGVDIRYPDLSGPDTMDSDDLVIAIRSDLGAVHAWSIGVGDHVVLALRSPGESLDVLVDSGLDTDISDDVVIGQIPASVSAGQVAVMELTADPLTFTYVATRPPTDAELGNAAGHGIGADGRFID